MAKYTNRIQVNVSNTLRDRVALEAKRMGVTVPEYVRYALLNELESVNSVDDIDRELLKDLPEAIDDYNNGRVIETHCLEEALDVLKDHEEYD
jgi:hypothetical protein